MTSFVPSICVLAMNGSSHISPSLRTRTKSGQAAREFKFVIPASKAAKLAMFASESMGSDPYCTNDSYSESGIKNSYGVQSVYLDTPAKDILYRNMDFRFNKYRIRRYGSSDILFLERKSKRNSELTKQRLSIPLKQLGDLDRWCDQSGHAVGNWFVEEAIRHRLRPVCSIAYQRQAFFLDSDNSSLRLTLDHSLSSKACESIRFSDQDWSNSHRNVDPLDPLGFVINDQVVVEMKFEGALPALFKRWIAELDISPMRFSKYRMAMHCLVFSAGAMPC